MEVEINGEWKKGVAVRLQHGTVITWDARLIRHCTSLPRLQVRKGRVRKGEAVSMNTERILASTEELLVSLRGTTSPLEGNESELRLETKAKGNIGSRQTKTK